MPNRQNATLGDFCLSPLPVTLFLTHCACAFEHFTERYELTICPKRHIVARGIGLRLLSRFTYRHTCRQRAGQSFFWHLVIFLLSTHILPAFACFLFRTGMPPDVSQRFFPWVKEQTNTRFACREWVHIPPCTLL